MKKNAVILLALMGAWGSALAQQQTVRMKTSMTQGSEMTLVVNGSARGLKVDWGNGSMVEIAQPQDKSPLLQIKGIVQGENIQLSSEGNLTFLDCEACELTELGLQEARDLHSLYCAHNDLSVLDVRKMVQLVNLDCSYNQLNKFVFSSYDTKKAGEDLPLMEHLDLSHNHFSSVYKWVLPSLRHLNICGNQYTSVDVGDKTLQFLNCAENQLKGSLHLQNLVNLQSLLTHHNQLTSLSLYNKGERVQQLFCDSNRLQTLDLAQAADLEDLSCSSNRLKQLQMPGKPKLSSLNVSSNSLDFSVLPSKRVAPEYLSFMPQNPFDLKNVEGVRVKDNIPYIPLSESWSRRHYVDLVSQGSLIGNRYDAETTWYSIENDGSVKEMTQRKSSVGTEDFYTNHGKTAFFNAHQKAYAQLVSKSYGYTINSVPVAIGDDVTGVENLRTESDDLQMEVEPSTLILKGHREVHIFTLEGKCVWKGIVSGEERVTLPKGIYIVNKEKVVL